MSFCRRGAFGFGMRSLEVHGPQMITTCQELILRSCANIAVFRDRLCGDCEPGSDGRIALCCFVVGGGKTFPPEADGPRVASLWKEINVPKSGFVLSPEGVLVDNNSVGIPEYFLAFHSQFLSFRDDVVRLQDRRLTYRIFLHQQQAVKARFVAIFWNTGNVLQSLHLFVENPRFQKLCWRLAGILVGHREDVPGVTSRRIVDFWDEANFRRPLYRSGNNPGA